MVMTVPQVLTIWVSHRAAGNIDAVKGCVPRLSRRLTLVRLAERDKNIYLPCMGWILLDSAVIVGALVYG